ncbi:MAG: RES family NAD+ phosphorylase [Limisphaerales bacterium]
MARGHGLFPWSRAIGYRHLLGPPRGQTGPPQPLWGGAAKTVGARFTPIGSFDSIYLAHDPVTAFIEVSALILLPGGPVPVRTAPWVVVSVDGIINHLLDLTDAATLAALGTTAQEMTGTWAAITHPPTQLLGRLAYDSGRIAGIKYASAKNPGGLNVAVFSDRIPIAAGNYLEVYDPHGNLAQRISA